MTEDEAYKVHIQYTFNAFCKIVIRHVAIDIILKLRRRWEREVSLYLQSKIIKMGDCFFSLPSSNRGPAAGSLFRSLHIFLTPPFRNSRGETPACFRNTV